MKSEPERSIEVEVFAVTNSPERSLEKDTQLERIVLGMRKLRIVFKKACFSGDMHRAEV